MENIKTDITEAVTTCDNLINFINRHQPTIADSNHWIFEVIEHQAHTIKLLIQNFEKSKDE